MSDMNDLEKVIQESATDMKAFMDRSEKKLAEFGDRQFLLEQKMAGGPLRGNSPDHVKTLSEEVQAHPNFKNFKAGGSDKVRMTFSRPMETKATIVSSAALARAERLPEIVTPNERRFTIRSLLPSTPTRNNAVEFTRELLFTNAAAPQAGEGVAKAESSITFELATAPVRTIAHWIPASKQILDDAPALADHIDRRLRYGLGLVEESQLLAGDGIGQNLLGLIPQATAYNVALNIVGDTRIDRIRRAIYQISLAEHQANGVVLNAFDWMAVELLKDAEDRYLFGGPDNPAGPRMWGLPVVSTLAISAGTFLVGDFAQAAMVFDREEATIEISNSHSDFFTRNLLAILGEARLALAVFTPAAMVYGSFA